MEIEQLISEFRAITTQDSRCAARYLRSANWDLQTALSNFFTADHYSQTQDYDYMAVDDNAAGGRGLDSRPVNLIHSGSFEESKAYANRKDKWLIVNIQSNTEFNSHMLNTHTWSNPVLAESIKDKFVFWQIGDDEVEGKKVCNYYRVQVLPVIMVIDPVTGLRMKVWSGMVEAENLLEDLMYYSDHSPRKTPDDKFKAVAQAIHRERRALRC